MLTQTIWLRTAINVACAAMMIWMVFLSNSQSGERQKQDGVKERHKDIPNLKIVKPVDNVYKNLDEKDKTLVWLEKMFDERSVYLTFIKANPKWNDLRSNTRFQDLLRRMDFEK